MRRISASSLVLVAALVMPADLAHAALVAAVAVAGDTPVEDSRELIAAVRGGLMELKGVSMLSSVEEDALFRAPAPPPILPDLAVSRRSIRRAAKSFNAFRLDEAREHLEAAEQALAPWNGTPEARELLRERLALAVSLAHAERDDGRLERALKAYAQAFPGEQPPKGTPWPPAIAARLAKVQPAADAAIIVSAPAPGTVFVDGKEIGAAPATAEGLTRGEHRIIVEAPGFFRADRTVTLEAGQRAALTVELSADLSAKLRRVNLDPPLAAPVQESLVTAARAKAVNLVVLVEPRGNGLIFRRVDVVGPPPNTVQKVIAPSQTQEQIVFALRQLIEPLEALAPSVSAQPSAIPLWAWIGLGAGAAAVGLGTALRLDAAGMQRDYNARQDAITQADAFAIREDADGQASRGSILLGAGAVAVVGVGGWLAYQLIQNGSEP